MDRIESFLKLGNLKHEYDEKLIIKANDQGLSVFITREASTDTRDILICDKLADLLNVDMPSLVSFVSLPVYMVEEMLKIQNIPELPDGHRTHLPDASTAIHTVTRVILDVSPGSDRTPSDDVDVGATPPIRHDSTPVTGARASFAVGAFDDVDVVAGPPVGRDRAPMAGSRRSFPIDVDNDSNPDEESNLEVNLLCHMAAGLTIEADTVVVGGRREPGLTDFSESLTIASDVAAAYIDNAFTRVNKIRGFARPSSSSRGGHSLNVRPKVTIFQQDNGRSGEFLVSVNLRTISRFLKHFLHSRSTPSYQRSCLGLDQTTGRVRRGADFLDLNLTRELLGLISSIKTTKGLSPVFCWGTRRKLLGEMHGLHTT